VGYTKSHKKALNRRIKNGEGNIKSAIHPQVNWAILLYDVIPDGKTD